MTEALPLFDIVEVDMIRRYISYGRCVGTSRRYVSMPLHNFIMTPGAIMWNEWSNGENRVLYSISVDVILDNTAEA